MQSRRPGRPAPFPRPHHIGQKTSSSNATFCTIHDQRFLPAAVVFITLVPHTPLDQTFRGPKCPQNAPKRPQNEIPKITTLPRLCWNTVLLQVIMIAQNVEWIIPLHFLFNMIVASSQCRTSFMTLPQLTMFAQVTDNVCSHCYMGNYHQWLSPIFKFGCRPPTMSQIWFDFCF